MTKVEQYRILTTLVQHFDHDTTVDAGGVMRVPVSDFTCPDLLAQEQALFFRQTPLCMGLSSELPAPNTYWAVTFANVPILMVRDGDGQFRAYANVCRHRGNTLVPEGCGINTSFACAYHGWTYGNDGGLEFVYKEDHFGPVCKDELSLIELPAAELAGTLWVRPTPGEPIEAATCLGDLEEELANWNLAAYPPAGRQRIDGRMNWKLAIHTYGELYHIKILHAKTAARDLLGDVQVFDAFGRNARLIGANKKMNLLRLFMADLGRWPYTQIASTGYFLYPNTFLVVDEFGVQVLHFFPLENAVGKSRTVHSWYIDTRFQQHFLESAKSYADILTRFRTVVETEDYPVMEQVQLNAEWGVPPEIVLGRNELPIQHIHNVHRQSLGRKALPLEPMVLERVSP